MVFLILTVLISTVWSILIYRIYTSNLNLIIKIVIIAFCFTIAVYLMPICFIFIPVFFKILYDRKITLAKYNTFLLVILVIILNLDTIRMHFEQKYYCEYKKDYTIEIIDDNYTIEDIENFYFSNNKQVEKNKIHISKKIHSHNIYKNNNVYEGQIIAKGYDYFIPYDSFNATLNKLGSGSDGEYCTLHMGSIKEQVDSFYLSNYFENNLNNKKDKK